MVKNYTFNNKSIWNYFLKINISTFSIIVFGASLYYYIKNKSSIETVLIGALGALLGWFLFFALPLMILFLNHRKHSKNVDFSVNSDNSFKYVALALLLFWIVIFLLPLMILFLNHRKHSKNVDFSVNSDNSFKYINGYNEINFNLQDIEKVELWLTPADYDKRIHWIGFEKYFFTRICTKQNQIINLSCLICDETEQIFNKDLIVRKKKLFPLMKQNKI